MASEVYEKLAPRDEDGVTDRVLTVPNLITFIRLLLLPVFLWLEFGLHNEIAALVVFALASGTDWVDGQVARRTNQVSRLGKVLDPFVDRLLIAVGVIAVWGLGRVPTWILVFLIARDLLLIAGGRLLLGVGAPLPAVIYPGKFATAFIMFGFCFLLLGWPVTPSLGIAGAPSWLPGFGAGPVLFGTWLLYIGIVLSASVFCYYVWCGVTSYLEARSESH